MTKHPTFTAPVNGRVMNASRWGLFYAHVENGQISKIEPYEDDPRPSPNLKRLEKLVDAPHRILHPMVRKGFLTDGIDSRTIRGKDDFVQVSWDVALDLAAKHLNRVYDTFGPNAVWGYSYGWQSSGRVSPAVTGVRRLLTLRGGYVKAENNYSNAAISRIMPYVVGQRDPRSTAWDVILKHTQRIVFWSADPLVTGDIDWFAPLHQGMGYLEKLKARSDIKTYAINPIRPETARELDSHWLALKPSTDTALMLGLIHELVRTKKANLDFLARYCVGGSHVLDNVAGKLDGVEKSAAWAASITGLSEAAIRDLAADLADHRTMLMFGWGMQRQRFGEQTHWLGVALAAVLGQIGLPGGGFGTNYHYSSGGALRGKGPMLGGLSSGRQPEGAPKLVGPFPVARFAECFLNPGKTIEFDGTTLTYPDIRFVMWAGGNPFAHHPQTMNLEAAWSRPECVLCVDSVWSATAKRADIVLPAAVSLERNDITNIGAYTNDGVVAMKKAVEPKGEAKTDFWIADQLARRMGLGDAFSEGKTEEAWIESLYNDLRDKLHAMGIDAPDFATFWEDGIFRFPLDETSRDFVAFGDFRADPDAHPLATPSGKIELFSDRIVAYGYADCPGSPTYMASDVETPDERFPLALLSAKTMKRLHSQLDGVLPEDRHRAPVWIHPEDAKERGIKEADLVLVKSRYGEILAETFITDDVRPGCVVVHHGAWFDPQEVAGRAIDVHGNANTLTRDVPTSSLGQGNVISGVSVEVSPWTGDVPDVKAFDHP